jgi:predicted CopG family antitoxin
MGKWTTISVKTSTWAKLKEIGKMGESFDDVINKLLKVYKEYKK